VPTTSTLGGDKDLCSCSWQFVISGLKLKRIGIAQG